jgi:hypothetical protein
MRFADNYSFLGVSECFLWTGDGILLAVRSTTLLQKTAVQAPTLVATAQKPGSVGRSMCSDVALTRTRGLTGLAVSKARPVMACWPAWGDAVVDGAGPQSNFLRTSSATNS